MDGSDPEKKNGNNGNLSSNFDPSALGYELVLKAQLD